MTSARARHVAAALAIGLLVVPVGRTAGAAADTPAGPAPGRVVPAGAAAGTAAGTTAGPAPSATAAGDLASVTLPRPADACAILLPAARRAAGLIAARCHGRGPLRLSWGPGGGPARVVDANLEAEAGGGTPAAARPLVAVHVPLAGWPARLGLPSAWARWALPPGAAVDAALVASRSGDAGHAAARAGGDAGTGGAPPAAPEARATLSLQATLAGDGGEWPMAAALGPASALAGAAPRVAGAAGWVRVAVRPQAAWDRIEAAMAEQSPLAYTLARVQLDAMEADRGVSWRRDILGAEPQAWTAFVGGPAASLRPLGAIVPVARGTAACSYLAEALAVAAQITGALSAQPARVSGLPALHVGRGAAAGLWLACLPTALVIAPSAEGCAALAAAAGRRQPHTQRRAAAPDQVAEVALSAAALRRLGLAATAPLAAAVRAVDHGVALSGSFVAVPQRASPP